jgi:hypothetical protein
MQPAHDTFLGGGMLNAHVASVVLKGADPRTTRTLLSIHQSMSRTVGMALPPSKKRETEIPVRVEPDLLTDPQGCVFRVRSVEISAGGTEADAVLLHCDQVDDKQELA